MKVSFIASKTVLRSITCPGQFFWLCAQIIIIIIIFQDDNKLPDGTTILPWARGKPMAWDVTVPDTC